MSLKTDIRSVMVTKFCARGETSKCVLTYFNLLKKKHKTEKYLKLITF